MIFKNNTDFLGKVHHLSQILTASLRLTPLSVIRSRSVKVQNWCNVSSMEDITVYGHPPECRVTK